MNKFTFLFPALLCLPGLWSSSYAQGLSFEEEVALVTAPLDVGDLQTGLLIDRSVEYLPLGLFDGRTDIDSFLFTTRDLQFAYAMLSMAHTDTVPLVPTADEYWERMELYRDAPFVMLSGLLYRFDYIRDDAVDENLLYVSDEQLFDVVSRTESPYQVDTTWLAAAGRNTWRGDSVVFRTSLSLWPSNMNLQESNLLIDYDNGTGWEQVTFLLDTTVVYSTYGEKIIRFGYVLNPGDTLIAQSSLTLEGLILPFHLEMGDRGGTYNIQRDDSFHIGDTYERPIMEWQFDPLTGEGAQVVIGWETAPLNGVEVSIFYNKNCGDPEVRKPLIVIEGFDPANAYDERFLFEGEFNSKNTQIGPSLLGQTYNDPNDIFLRDHLHDTDYDVFYINYVNSVIEAQENAAYVIEAIQEINRLKAEAGSREKNVVIGASLGGIIGKIALRQMEIAEEDHETELYITFDSPLKGANVPMALQAMIYHLSNYKVAGTTLYERDASIRSQYDALFSPAAKQLLHYHVNQAPFFNFQELTRTGTQLSYLHDQFYTWFEGLGDLMTCEQIAISNGAIEGSGMPFSPGDELFDIVTFDLQGKDNPILNLSVHFKGYALPLPDTTQKVYEGVVQTVIGNVVTKTSVKALNVQNVQPYDSAPGAMQTFYEVENGVRTPLVGDANYRSFSFIPTISSLALDHTDPYYPALDLTEVNDIINNGFTSLAAYTGPTEISSHYDGDVLSVNQPHITLDRRHVRHLLSRIGSLAHPPSLLDDKTFNFGRGEMIEFDPLEAGIRGTDNIIRNSVEVAGPGKLWINQLNRIGYIDDTENPETGTDTYFEVNVIKNPCSQDPTIIDINNGGELKIGEADTSGWLNTGHLILHEDTKLVIDDGGEVLVKKQSKIVVKEGAVLEVKDGGLLEPVWNAVIEIEDGGEMVVREGGVLQLISDQSRVVVKEGGKLTLEEGAIVNLWDAGPVDGTVKIEVRGELEIAGDIAIDGNGYFDIYNTHTLSLPGGGLVLEGYSKATRLVRLNEGTKLELGSNNFGLKDARIDYYSHTWISATGGTTVMIENAHLNSVGTAGSGLLIDDYRRLRLEDTEVTGFENTGVSVYANDGTFPVIHTYIAGCTFEDNGTGLAIEAVRQAHVISSEFTSTTPGTGEGILFSDVEQLMVTGSGFTDLSIGLYAVDERSRLVLTSVEVAGCDYGVRALPGAELNLIARQGTVFEENGTAIQIAEGGFGVNGDYGLVLLDCVKLLNNDLGVEGKDLLLQIDAYTNSASANALRSNTFRCNQGQGQLLFRLCFDERDISTVNPIPARGNYWDFTLPFTVEPWYTKRVTCTPSSTAGMINYSNAVTSEPSGCPYSDISDPAHTEMECLIPVALSSDINVRTVYKNFYKSWREEVDNGHYDPEGDWYGYLSEVNYIDAGSFTMTGKCKHQLDVLNTFRKGTLVLRRAPEGEGEAGVFRAYPNPVSTSLYCELPAGEWEIMITDVRGKEVVRYVSRAGEAVVEVDCGRLPAGMYFVQGISVAGADGARTEIVKFVKQ